MAIRLAQELELTPLEGEKKLNQIPDPAEETARAEQTRIDEEARRAELASADSFLSKIKGLDRRGIEMTSAEQEQEDRFVGWIEREIQSIDALVSNNKKLTETERIRLQYQADILRSLVLNGVVYAEKVMFEKHYSRPGDSNTMNDAWRAFDKTAKLIEAQGTGESVFAIDHDGSLAIKFLGRPGSRYELHRKIDSARDFDELLAVIEKNGGIQGSQKFYSPEEIKKFIRQLREAWFQHQKISDEKIRESTKGEASLQQRKINDTITWLSSERQRYNEEEERMLLEFTANGGLREKMRVLLNKIAHIDHYRENKYLKGD